LKKRWESDGNDLRIVTAPAPPPSDVIGTSSRLAAIRTELDLMKTGTGFSWLATVFALTAATIPLRADTTNPPTSSIDRQQFYELLGNMPPEERRAKIEFLRQQRAAQFNSDQPPAALRLSTNVPLRTERLILGGPEVGLMPVFSRVLTEAQRTSLRKAMETQRDKTRVLEEKIRKARKEVVAASFAEPFDENAVRAKALAAAKLEADLEVMRAKAFAQMKPPPSAEQVEKLKTLPLFNPAPPPSPLFVPRSPTLKQVPSRTLRLPSGPRDENDLPIVGQSEK
jgi:uncharacterized membrane protein